MTRCLAVVLLPVLWASPALAQAPRSALRNDVASLLDSQDVRRQAWGVWIAGRDRIGAAQPRLEQIAAAAIEDNEHASILDFVLDALIELRAKLTPDLLARIAERRPTEGLILLALVPDSTVDRALLDVMTRERGYAWFAAANQLLPRHPPGFAARLLTGLRLAAYITISDSGQTFSGFGRSFGIGCGLAGLTDGMPPWPSYALTSNPRAGDSVLALGPTSIYYTRRVSEAGSTPVHNVLSEDGPTADDRLGYVAAVLERAPELRGRTDRAVARRPGLDIAKIEAEVRRELGARHAALVRELVDDGHLTEEEAAALTVDVDVTVDEVH